MNEWIILYMQHVNDKPVCPNPALVFNNAFKYTDALITELNAKF